MLNVNNLIGFGAGGAGITGFGFRDSTTASGSGPVYTFSGASIGTANASRSVIVAVSTNNVASYTSLTVGGITATKLYEKQSDTAADRRVGLFIVIVPTGTTADVVLTCGDTGTEWGCAVWSGNNISHTLFHESYDTDSSANTTSINVPAGGAIIGSCLTNNDPTNIVWTGLTEDYDVDTGFHQWAVASASNMPAETGRAVTVSGAGVDGILATVSFEAA